MTHRERVLEALEHRPADRVPTNFHANVEVYEALYERFGLHTPDDVHEMLDVDMRRVEAPYGQEATGPDDEGYLRTMWGVRYLPEGDARRNNQPPYWISPFSESTTVDEVMAHEWPDPAQLDFSSAREQCLAHHEEYFTYGSPWSPFFHEVGWMIGQEDFLVWMHTKPEVLQAIIDRVVDYEIEATRLFLKATHGLLDMTYFGNDFGAQRSLFVSPATYQQFIREPLKRYFDASHDFGCRVMKHSCGAVRDIIPWFIEDGVDVLDPVQVNAAGMALDGLKRDFGGRICFHGGVDTQTTLPFGAAGEVRAEVRSYIELFETDGGYILNGSQNYIDDIPLENLLAIYDEASR